MPVIEFLGDSVTDARNTDGLNSPYGTGFVSVVNNTLQFRYPDAAKYQVLNKGIGGQTLLQIIDRLQKDVLDVHPDLLFILAGVNDSWRKFDSPNGGTPDDVFLRYYDDMVKTILKKSPSTSIILMTPYVLEVNEMSRKIRGDIPGKIAAVREIASKRGLELIDLSFIMDLMTLYLPKTDIALDGVHPAVMGCAIIANEAVKAIERHFSLR